MKPKCFNGGVFQLLKPALLLITILMSTTASAASSYLQELEAEAAATDNDTSKKGTETKPAWSQQNAGTHETIEKGLTKPQFEEALKAHFYGSYLFYSTLADSKQKIVYGEYQKNNDIEHLREVIKAQMSN